MPLNALHLRWLSLMGYTVKENSYSQLTACFEREARQWEMTPEALRDLVTELYEPHWTSERPEPRRQVPAEMPMSKAA
ncbi:MAG: hypothetical protein ACR2GR_03365 [Rhodothermales bacterium]